MLLPTQESNFKIVSKLNNLLHYFTKHRNNIVFQLEMFRKIQNDILYRDAIFKNVSVQVKSRRLKTLSSKHIAK